MRDIQKPPQAGMSSWSQKYSIDLRPQSSPKATSPSYTYGTLSQTDCRTKTISTEELKDWISSLPGGWNGHLRGRVRLLEAELESTASTGHEASPLTSETGVRIAIIRGFLKRMDCWTAVLMGP